MTDIKIVRVKNENGDMPPVPAKATDGSAGFDLCAFINESVSIMPGGLCKIFTGIKISLPEGYAGLIMGRSGLGTKHGIMPSNAVGLIDSDYRGELCVGLCNVSDKPYTINPLDRIAQLVIVPVLDAFLSEAGVLDETDRGDAGFGSSGK